MFMLTLDSPEVLDHLYPKMTTKGLLDKLNLHMHSVLSCSPKRGLEAARVRMHFRQAHSTSIPSRTLSPPPPVQSTPLCKLPAISSLPVLNEMTQSGRRREAEGDATREERAKCRQTMNDISPPSLLSSIPVFPFHLASLVTAIIALPAWVLLAGRGLVPSTIPTDDYCFCNTTKDQFGLSLNILVAEIDTKKYMHEYK